MLKLWSFCLVVFVTFAVPHAVAQNQEAEFWQRIAFDSDNTDIKLEFANWLTSKGDKRGQVLKAVLQYLEISSHGVYPARAHVGMGGIEAALVAAFKKAPKTDNRIKTLLQSLRKRSTAYPDDELSKGVSQLTFLQTRELESIRTIFSRLAGDRIIKNAYLAFIDNALGGLRIRLESSATFAISPRDITEMRSVSLFSEGEPTALFDYFVGNLEDLHSLEIRDTDVLDSLVKNKSALRTLKHLSVMLGDSIGVEAGKLVSVLRKCNCQLDTLNVAIRDGYFDEVVALLSLPAVASVKHLRFYRHMWSLDSENYNWKKALRNLKELQSFSYLEPFIFSTADVEPTIKPSISMVEALALTPVQHVEIDLPRTDDETDTINEGLASLLTPLAKMMTKSKTLTSLSLRYPDHQPVLLANAGEQIAQLWQNHQVPEGFYFQPINSRSSFTDISSTLIPDRSARVAELVVKVLTAPDICESSLVKSIK